MITLLPMLLGIVLPGVAAALVIDIVRTRRGRHARRYADAESAPGSFLARAATSGVSIWLLTCGLVERTAGITAVSSWTSTIALAAVSVAVVMLPAARRQLRAATADLLQGAAVVAVAIVSWFPLAVLNAQTSWGPLSSTPWYYWGLAADIAQAHHVPATAVEWGTRVPFLADYHLFSTGTASMIEQSGGSQVAALHVVMFVALAQLALGASVLASALGAGRLASVAAVPVALGAGIGAIRLASYRPEAFGLGLTLLAAACFVFWLRGLDPAGLGVAALGLGTLWQVHGIAAVVAAILCAAAVLANLPHRTMLGSYLKRVGLGALGLAAVALVTRVATGSTTTAANMGGLGDRGGRQDPTWGFVRAIAGLQTSDPPTNGELVMKTLHAAYGGKGSFWVLLVAGAAAAGVVLAAVRSVRSRRTLAFYGAALVGIALAASVFAFGWDGYVPRRTGAQRLVLEATLLTGPLVACGVGSLRLRWRAVPSWLPGVATVGVLSVLAVVSNDARADSLAHQRPLQSDMRTLAATVRPEPGKFVLANAYTEGYIRRVTGADALLDGRAPYTFPKVLDRSIRLLREGQAFFRNPSAHVGLLAGERISYVLVSRRHSYALGTSNVFRTSVDRRALRSLPGLELVAQTSGLWVFRVQPVESLD